MAKLKELICISCPYCDKEANISLLDSIIRFIRAVISKDKKINSKIIFCSKCHKCFEVNNVIIDFLISCMIFAGIMSNIIGWPSYMARYKIGYFVVLIILFFYSGATRKTHKVANFSTKNSK